MEELVGEDGAFRVGALAPGEYELYGWGSSAGTDVLRVAAGASGVELHSAARHEVRVRVEHSAGEFALDVHDLERGTWESSSEPTPDFSEWLTPGTYALVASDADGRIGFVPRLCVEARESVARVVLEMLPGARVTLVHRALEGVRAPRLSLNGSPFPLMPVLDGGGLEGLAPGAARTLFLPPGELVAELLEHGRVVASETATLLGGERRRIVLEPR